MKKILGTVSFTLLVGVIIVTPYILLSDYVKEIRELNVKVQMLQDTIDEVQKQNRLLMQDVEIINNIILEKDFLKRLD